MNVTTLIASPKLLPASTKLASQKFKLNKNKTNIHYANNHCEQDTSLIKQLKSTEIAIREQPWQDTSVFIFCF